MFNEEDNDLYVHHDIVLPTVPLSMEWLSYSSSLADPGEKQILDVVANSWLLKLLYIKKYQHFLLSHI